MAQTVEIQFRQGLSSGSEGWTEINPVLASGEPGFETDTKTLKIGDGSSAWVDLGNFRSGSSVALGQYAGQTGQNPAATSIGQQSGSFNQGIAATSIGSQAGNTNQGNYSVAVGPAAGQTGQGSSSIAIGRLAGQTNQDINSTAIGFSAGQTGQGPYSTAIGFSAGQSSQAPFSIAIGDGSGKNGQGPYSVALGSAAGQTGQGPNCIAVGRLAGQTNQASNTIILNASGSEVSGVSGQTGSFYVAPVRNTSGITGSVPLSYNTSTSEVMATGLAGGVITGSIYPSQDGQFDLGITGARFRSIHAVTASISTNTLLMSNSSGDNAAMSFAGGKFYFTDHKSKNLMSVGPSGFTFENYVQAYGPGGIFGPPGSTGFNEYNILGFSVLNDGDPLTTTTYIADGGYPINDFTYLADEILPEVISYNIPNEYNILGFSVLNDGDPLTTTTYIADGGYPINDYTYIADEILPEVISY